MSDSQACKEFYSKGIAFSKQRYGDPDGFLVASDIKAGKTYVTQFGHTKILTDPFVRVSPLTRRMSYFVEATAIDGNQRYCGLLDLAWIGVIPIKNGLWAKGGFCNEFFFDLRGELV